MYFCADTVLFTDELSTEAPVTESNSMIEELLAAVRLVLSEGLVRQVGACFQFHISASTGQTRSYYVDLTQSTVATHLCSLKGILGFTFIISYECLNSLNYPQTHNFMLAEMLTACSSIGFC